MKKTIIHCIYNLGRGGAETMLVQVLKALPEYNNVVITLMDDNRFGNELSCDKYICLNLSGLRQLPLAIKKLRKIIISEKADMVHSHLYWPTFLARLSTPKNIPLVTTIHTSVSGSADYRKKYIVWLDRITSKIKPSTIIAVSNVAMNDYRQMIYRNPLHSSVVNTFINDEKIISAAPASNRDHFRFVSTGALRLQKNFHFLIENWPEGKGESLDIYGSGPEKNALEILCKKTRALVTLKGEVNDVLQTLPLYNGYVSASAVEGFSLSVLEAMAANLPLLLSDIPSFREQCGDTAMYFEPGNNKAFLEGLEKFVADEEGRKKRTENAYNRLKNNYTLAHHIRGLHEVYSKVLGDA